jgi:uncharacterized RDD family membrane protein YckC
MDVNNYSEKSLRELYKLYTKMNQDNEPAEAQIIFEEILRKEKAEYETESHGKLASLSDRLAAALVDMVLTGMPVLLLIIIFIGLSKWLTLFRENTQVYTIVMLIVGQAVYLALHGRLLYKYGQIIGKKFLSIKIVDMNNELPELFSSYGMRYFVPSIINIIPFIGGFIYLADILFIFRKDRRCIHDHLAGTKVISADRLLHGTENVVL